MSLQRDRDQLIAQLSRELPNESTYTVVDLAQKLLRAGATLHRIAELECSSEAADRDRVPCPGSKKGAQDSDCCCDYGSSGDPTMHESVPRVTAQAKRIERRLIELLAKYGMTPIFQGDPRGPVLKVIPPSYTTRNAGRNPHDLEGIYVS